VRATLVALGVAVAGCQQLLGLRDLPIIDAPFGYEDQAATWTVDPTSGKAVPASRVEWLSFIVANHLRVAPPDGLWLMQETGGDLADAIGSVTLAATGPMNGGPAYQQVVPGWSRRAVATHDGTIDAFGNPTSSALPSLATQSIALLMFYATATSPAAVRTIASAGNNTTFAEIVIDPNGHLGLVTGFNSMLGTATYGAAVTPIWLEVDTSGQRHEVITNVEAIVVQFVQLADGRGIFLGNVNNHAPDGRWLYMAAWYGVNAELADADIHAVITALGF
jgi:hypothetical protein